MLCVAKKQIQWFDRNNKVNSGKEGFLWEERKGPEDICTKL